MSRFRGSGFLVQVLRWLFWYGVSGGVFGVTGGVFGVRVFSRFEASRFWISGSGFHFRDGRFGVFEVWGYGCCVWDRSSRGSGFRGSGFRVQGFAVRGSGFRVRVRGSVFSRFWVLGTGFRGSRLMGLGFRGPGFQVRGSGFRVRHGG